MLIPIVALLWAANVRAEPPTPEQIQQWIAELDHSNFKTREQAAKKLRQAGPDVAAPLAKAAKTASVEVADRALRILGEMADGNDAKAETAARRHLRRLADGESRVAGEAKSILNRKRNRLLVQLMFAGAAYDEHREEITRIDLDNVADLEAVLPILKYFPELETLSISNRKFTDKMAAHLADLPNLRDLNLFQSGIGDEAFKHLTGLKNLRRIPMGQTRVTDEGLKIISGMTQLEYVGVRGNNVTDAGLVHLKGLTNLTGLYLGESKVTDAGLKHLAPLKRLQFLILDKSPITDAGLEHLKELKELRDLYVTGTRITKEGRARLKDALPDLDIHDRSER
jgi:Leucine-rich repeat (LRR) protein